MVGDVLDVEADVVAFKHAGRFYGADRAAAERLEDVGYHPGDLEAPDGEHRYVESLGSLGSHGALFVGVGPLVGLGYDKVKTFSREVVEIAARELGVRHLAMTIHGSGFGLDEQEALLSQVAGFLEALQGLQQSPSLEKISIVEGDPKRADLLGRTLEGHLQDIPYARVEESAAGLWRFRIGTTAGDAGRRGAAQAEQAIPLLARTPEREPHVFIAYPFELEDHARYGLERPSQQAGFLARLIGNQIYTGEILQRIMNQIESAALVVAVLTRANPNVYLELGYAWGKGKTTVLVAQEDEDLRFDVAGHRVVRYQTITELESKYVGELEGLRSTGVL